MNLPASRSLLALLCLAWLTGPGLASAQTPPDTGEWRLSLNGRWDFTTSPAVAAGTGAWDSLDVPGNWDTQPAYANHRGKAWYRRTFTVPAEWTGLHLRLRFEAVYHDAEVWLDGQLLGTHSGGYTPFEFNVTAQAAPGSSHTLLVSADNTYARGAWWPWGGISRDVALIAHRDVRIVHQHIHAAPNLAAGTALVSVRYRLANAASSPRTASLSATIDGVPEPALATEITLPAGAKADITLQTTLPASRVRLWHFDHPNLSSLTTSIHRGGDLQHALSSRFGIRKIEVTPAGLWLNGEKVRLAGFNRVADDLVHGNTEPEARIREDIDMMKRAGANFGRIGPVPQSPAFLDYLDEVGMLIFAEIPVWGKDDPQVYAGNPLTKQWLAEMIDRDYNHPCIIGWGVGNELNNHYSYVQSMIDYVRTELDPHRLLTYFSFTAFKKGYGPANDPVTFSDLAMVNVYAPTGVGSIPTVPDTLRSRWPDKPVFFSEYGASQIGASLDATIPRLDDIWDAIVINHPYVIGAALWNFNDYRSDYPGTPAAGNRTWGVVDVHRQPKAAYAQIRHLYRPAAVLEVADGAVRIVPRGLLEIPSYTLRGYEIAWTLADAEAQVFAEGRISVPDLAPSSAAWMAVIPGAEFAETVSAALVTPTGYQVQEAFEGPAAHWKFDETSTIQAIDSSPNQLTMALSGGVSRVAGPLGNALRLDGATGYGRVPDSSVLDGASRLSLSFWVRPENLDGATPRFVVSKRVSFDTQTAYTAFFHTGNRLAIDLENYTYRFTSNTVFQNDRWYHIAITFDGSAPASSRARLYVDGALDRTASIPAAALSNRASDLWVGRADASASERFGGSIDDLRVLRKVLTAGEVSRLAAPRTLAAWRSSFFPGADPAEESTLWGDLADPDHDGISNLEEYYFGLHPRAASPAPAEFFATADAAGLRFWHATESPDASGVLEWSTDLAAWSQAGTTRRTIRFEPGMTLQEISVPTAGQERMFFRLKTTRR